MNFFEQELRKILCQTQYGEAATYVGRNAYLGLGGQRQAKVFFNIINTHNKFEALDVQILDKNNGKIDSARLLFSETLGKKQVDNPNFRGGIVPYIWIYDLGSNTEPEWYAYQPNMADYRLLGSEIEKYADLYHIQEQAMDAAQEQTMG